MKKMFNAFKNRKGFTLVEIIVVLAILAIIIAVAIPSLSGVLRDSRGKVLLQEARAALVGIQAKITQDNLLPVGNKFLALIDKDSTTGAGISVKAYYVGTVAADGKIDTSAGSFKLCGIIYCDTTKRSKDCTVFIPLNDTAAVYDTFAEADAAAKSFAYPDVSDTVNGKVLVSASPAAPSEEG